MKKFLLINSPIFPDSTDKKEDYLPPLGLGYIATILEKSEVNVELIDCVEERISVDNIIKHINSVSPEFVGINIFTPNYEFVQKIIESIHIKCQIFVGGQTVKAVYNEVLGWKTTNELIIIMGEAEYIIPKIVEGCCEVDPVITAGNKKVYRVDKDSIYFPSDISNIYLDRKFIKNEIVVNHYGMQEASIVTSRGCMYNCAFCGGARDLNKDISIRCRTKESIVAEIDELQRLYPGIQCIRILDDLFLRNDNSIKMAVDIFSEYDTLYWRGMAHVLSLVKSIDKINLLQQCGCKELFIGIESGSDRIRKKINKVGEQKQIIDVITEILRAGIDAKGYFIYGFPTETEKDFEDTYQLAYKLKEISRLTEGNFRTSVFQFRPYHGTQLYNEIKEKRGFVDCCKVNDSLNRFDGRAQFSFHSGNYSEESDKVLNAYIIKTQGLSEE